VKSIQGIRIHPKKRAKSTRCDVDELS